MSAIDFCAAAAFHGSPALSFVTPIRAVAAFHERVALSFVIPSVADLSRRAVEGSAVPRTHTGNMDVRPNRIVISTGAERSAVFFSLTHGLL
jgi:hypothetical protein